MYAILQKRSLLPSGAMALLMASLFSMGAAGIVTEYVLATVSTYVLGNSVEQFSIVIAIMLGMMGIGGATQKFIGSKHLVETFITIEIMLSLFAGFAPLVIYGGYAVLETYFPLVFGLTVSLIGFLIGFEIPLVGRINEVYAKDLKTNFACVFGMDYVGAFVGAFVWVYYLLPNFPLTEIGFIVSGSNFLVGIVTFLYFTRGSNALSKKIILSVIAASIAVLCYGWSHNREWSGVIEQRLYRSPIIHAETSKFQRLVLTRDSALDEYRLYLNGGLQFSSKDEHIYHEHLVHPAMAIAPRRERVLILGGGDGFALREVLKYADVREVLLVDIDPAIIRLASTHEVLRELNHNAFADARVSAKSSSAVTGEGFRPVRLSTGENDSLGRPEKLRVATVNVLTVDAFKFIADVGAGPWDVVIIDFPDPDQVEIAKLFSREFYRALGGSLSPYAVVAAQATSPYHAKETFLCIGRTFEAAGFHVLPYHVNVPSFGDWGFYLASLNFSSSALRSRVTSVPAIAVETDYLTPETMKAALAFGKTQLTARFDGINSIMQPVVNQYYLREGWKTQEDG